jgi:hypothetical protein
MIYTNWKGNEITRKSILESTGPGWIGIVGSLLDDLEALGWNGKLDQIKEKFGGLRFYIGPCETPNSVYIYNRIEEAQIESLSTCEMCGAPGGVDTNPTHRWFWIKTLCQPCHEKRWEDQPAVRCIKLAPNNKNSD